MVLRQTGLSVPALRPLQRCAGTEHMVGSSGAGIGWCSMGEGGKRGGGWKKSGWSSCSVRSHVYHQPFQTRTGVYRCRCRPGRGATLVPSAAIPVTRRYGVLPGKSSGTKNNQGIADGVSCLCMSVELARRLTPAGTSAAPLSCWARTGE